MARPLDLTTPYYDRFTRWLLKADKNERGDHPQHPWWKVMCLTGVDYFSTLGYQPGIAALAARSLAPLATLILVLLTLFGALPIYRRVARTSPHGEGSIAMLEHLLPRWKGKLLFEASVDAQGGAYATGVLVLMTSAAFAVTLLIRQQGNPRTFLLFALITLVFVYTTIVNIIERTEGIQIASFFIGSIIVISMLSRVLRSTELRVDRIEMDETAQRFLDEDPQETIRLLANRLDKGDLEEYFRKEKETRKDNHIPPTDAVLFLEIQVADASEFAGTVYIQGVEVGSYRILRARAVVVPNTIAALLLYLRDRTGKEPHVYFGWAEGNPLQFLMRFILLGEGDVAIMTREVLRKAEPDPERRPAIHIGG